MRINARADRESRGQLAHQTGSATGPGRGQPRRRLIVALGVLIILVTGISVSRHLSLPILPIPVPKNPASLDPMLRSFVTEKVAWARQAPSDPIRQATLGMVYAANGLWPEAKVAFENASRLEPGEPLPILYVAIAEQELGQLDASLRRLRGLTQRFPNFAPGFYRLGDNTLRQGAFDEAEHAFQRLIELAPKEWRGFAGLGEVKLRQEQTSEAVTLLEKAARLDPGAKPAHALLGQAYQRLGRLADAQRELGLGANAMHYPMPDAWSAQAPQYMRLMVDVLEMAQDYLKRGAPAKAIPILENARTFHPNHPILLVTLAQAYTMMGKPDQAEPLLQALVKADSSSVQGYVGLSGCALALGRTDEALSNADRAISLAPRRPEPYVAKANALLALERDQDAVAALRSAHENDPKNPQILVDLGDVCLRNLKKPQQALANYRDAVAQDPLLLPAQLRLASLYGQLGDESSALKSLEAARLLAPNDPNIAEALRRLRSTSPP
jgi:tetratricopeptide (TPR) repeat protein